MKVSVSSGLHNYRYAILNVFSSKDALSLRIYR